MQFATDMFIKLITIIPIKLNNALSFAAFLNSITLVPTKVDIAFGASVIAFVNINKTKNDEFFITMNCNASEINGVNLKGDMDVYIAKMDSNGKIIYNNSWGNDKEDYARDAYLTSNDELLVIGYTYSSIDTLNNKGKSDAFIVKYNQNGELIFQNSYGTEYTDMFHTVVELSDKNLS